VESTPKNRITSYRLSQIKSQKAPGGKDTNTQKKSKTIYTNQLAAKFGNFGLGFTS